MNDGLREETERLRRTWMTRDPAHLGSYLVSGVEDPRVNLQSVFSRHFLLRQITGEDWSGLMTHECRFAAAMNWLAAFARSELDPEALGSVLYALRQGADNAEGTPIPPILMQTFKHLPATVRGLRVPNYIAEFLEKTAFASDAPALPFAGIDTFGTLWRQALRSQDSGKVAAKLKVLEPACGSANDFRFLHAYGIADRIEYSGFDLCENNIVNARRLFPGVRFETGNLFNIAAGDREFDLCFMHDIFEHLSLAGLERALDEACRVTRLGLCASFFNMDEIPRHIERPYEDYHWNTLSVDQMKAAVVERGFACRILHIGTFLREELGCDHTHNPNAYTFILWRPGAE